MIFNVYFPAPIDSVFTPDSFDRVNGSVVSIVIADQTIPAKVLDVSVNDDGSGASFTFEVDGEIHHRVGPNLEDLITIRFKD